MKTVHPPISSTLCLVSASPVQSSSVVLSVSFKSDKLTHGFELFLASLWQESLTETSYKHDKLYENMFQLPWHPTFISDWNGSVGHCVLHIIHILFHLVMPLLILNKLLFKHFFRNNNLCSMLKLFASYIWQRLLSCCWQLILENVIVACLKVLSLGLFSLLCLWFTLGRI